MRLNLLQKSGLFRTLTNMTFCGERGLYGSSLYFNGRAFEIAKHDGEGYHAFELTPTGMLLCDGVDNEMDYLDGSFKDILPDRYRRSPNEFLAFCEERGIDPLWVCRFGGGLCEGLIYHETLEKAAHAIIAAIENNVVLVDINLATEHNGVDIQQPSRDEQIFYLRDRLAYWNLLLMEEGSAPTLFGDKRDMLNNGISVDNQKRLLHYLNKPTLAKWADIRGLCVTRCFTVWQLLVLADPFFPRSGSAFDEHTIPSRDTLVSVLSDAVRIHNEECRKNIDEISQELAMLSVSGAPALRVVS